MAIGQSMAHAQLMEAVSHNANRHLSFDRPSRAAAPEGFLFSDPPAPLAPIAVRLLPERGTRTPACVMQAKRGARRRERRERKLSVHRWRGEPKGSLRRRAIIQSAATIFAMKFCRDLRRRIPGGDEDRILRCKRTSLDGGIRLDCSPGMFSDRRDAVRLACQPKLRSSEGWW